MSATTSGTAERQPPPEPGTGAARPGRMTAAQHPLVLATGAVLAGVAIWLAFPGNDLWVGAPVGVALLALAVRGQSARRATWLGMLCGLACFVPLLAWSGIYVGRLPWFSLATLQALYVAAMAAAMPWAWRVPGGRGATVLTISALWVGQEALRSRTPFGGFPWGRIAFSQGDSPVLGVAALGGAPAVTAVVAAIGGCLAVALAGRGARSRLVAALTAPALLAGPLLVDRSAPEAAPGRTARVVAVQGNVPRAGLDFNAERRAVLDNHARLTKQLAAKVDSGATPRPAVVLWPENSSDIDPIRNADAAAQIQSAADAVGVPVVVGSVLEEPVGHLSNASIVWGHADGDTPGPGERYLKRRPAPFGEYIPYRSFFRLISDKVDLVRRDFQAGEGSPVITAGGIELGDVICFEVAYDDLVRDAVRQGSELLLVQTNNATFGRSDESVQQLAMSRLRAVESGRAVVHISTVGVSALIAPDGSVIDRSGHFTAEVLQADLPLLTGQRLATRLGALPELALSAGGIALLVAAGARSRSRRAVEAQQGARP